MQSLDDPEIGRTMPDMERPRFRTPTIRRVLVGVALGLALLASTARVGNAIGAAACQERARYELVSCAAAPEAWLLIVTGGLAVGLAILLGFLLTAGGTGRQLDPGDVNEDIAQR